MNLKHIATAAVTVCCLTAPALAGGLVSGDPLPPCFLPSGDPCLPQFLYGPVGPPAPPQPSVSAQSSILDLWSRQDETSKRMKMETELLWMRSQIEEQRLKQRELQTRLEAIEKRAGLSR
jgi:hypothetical protein